MCYRGQANAYADAKGHTGRHEILQQSLGQNRRWLAQMLEFTLADFSNYSQHNETPCRAVIHNIECLLGEAEIYRLSPTDCFAVLMTVYLHDPGMCITDEDRGKIIESKEFANWIEQLEQQRKHYAETAAERITQWVTNPAGLQNGFSGTGVPDRIFLLISQCAALHGISNLGDVMPLLMQFPESDNGFTQDFYHPRFAAVLLLIGDALDIDNQRFPPFAQQHAGRLFNKQSEMHYRKRRAIRALQISPERIYIRADCQDPSEMRQLRNEVNWLQQFIKECSYQWAKIAPKDFCGCLPVVDFERISLSGILMSERDPAIAEVSH